MIVGFLFFSNAEEYAMHPGQNCCDVVAAVAVVALFDSL